jgi:hypothetical protein
MYKINLYSELQMQELRRGDPNLLPSYMGWSIKDFKLKEVEAWVSDHFGIATEIRIL